MITADHLLRNMGIFISLSSTMQKYIQSDRLEEMFDQLIEFKELIFVIK
jgi:hypothetical protein